MNTDLLTQHKQLLAEIYKAEPWHKHEAVITNGKIHWKEAPGFVEMVNAIGMNQIRATLELAGFHKQADVLKNIYRKMGYSIMGYWEVFYDPLNNCPDDSLIIEVKTCEADRVEVDLNTYILSDPVPVYEGDLRQISNLLVGDELNIDIGLDDATVTRLK